LVNDETQRRWLETPFVRFVQRWLVTTVAVMVAANIVRGISYDTGVSLLVASLLLGILNALLRPLLLILSLPLVVLTLGLFALVINAFLLGFVGHLVKGFHVAGFWPAMLGAVVVSLITIILNTATGSGETRIDLRPPSQRRRDRREPPSDDGPPGKGPMIDV
jgi:putative membrane protein